MTDFRKEMLRDAAERWAGGKERVASIADDVSSSPPTIRRVAKALGIRRDEKRLHVMQSLRERVYDMQPLDAVSFLLDLCDNLVVDEEGEHFGGFRRLGFTPAQSRVLMELDANRGRVVSGKRLGAVSNPAGDTTLERVHIVKVHMSRIRALLTKTGLPVKVVLEYGTGYRLDAPVGYKWPWEAQP